LVIDVSSDPTKLAKHVQVELINMQLKRGEKRWTQTWSSPIFNASLPR
jgi:hypothetical protein